MPQLAFAGTPDASAPSGFTVSAEPVPGQNFGLYLYSLNGAAANPLVTPFGSLCLNTSGMKRIGAQSGGGTLGVCDGGYTFDFNTLASAGLDPALTTGVTVDTQVWYRDTPNPGGANFTEAGSFTYCP